MAELVVTVSNVLGIEQAAIPLPKAAPLGIAGPNAAGKTSLATAIGSVLSREANPLGLAPTAKPYLREGTDYGEVLLSGPGGAEYLRWVLAEKAMRVFAEAPPPLHRAAVGLTDFISRATARARGEIWESAFLPLPEHIEDELKKELRSALAGERMVADVIEVLREQGWESVEGVYRAKAKESKRDWSSITGEPYGTAKAPNWTPAGWRSDYDGVTPLEAEAALGDARDVLQALHVSGAVSAAEAQQAQNAAARLPGLRERRDDAARRLDEVRKAADAVEKEIAGIRTDGLEAKDKYKEHQRSKPQPSDGRPCPLCGGKIVVRDHALYAAEDDAALQQRIGEWEKRGEELSERLDFLRQKLAAAKQKGLPILKQRERAEEAKADVAADLRAAEAQAGGADSPVKADESEERIALAEQEVESRREALNLIQKRAEATEAHRSAASYSLIADLLGPRGIRGRAMKEGLGRLARGLRRVHELTNWPLVKLDQSYAVSAGERPVALCSTSEQWRAQTALQAGVALALGNNYAVLDGADVLDADGLTQLVVLCDALAAESGLSVIVCATGGRELFPQRWATVTVEEGRIPDAHPA